MNTATSTLRMLLYLVHLVKIFIPKKHTYFKGSTRESDTVPEINSIASGSCIKWDYAITQ